MRILDPDKIEQDRKDRLDGLTIGSPSPIPKAIPATAGRKEELTQYYMNPNDGSPMSVDEAERQGVTYGLPITNPLDPNQCKRQVADQEYVTVCFRPFFHWTIKRRDNQPVAKELADSVYTSHQEATKAITSYNAKKDSNNV